METNEVLSVARRCECKFENLFVFVYGPAINSILSRARPRLRLRTAGIGRTQPREQEKCDE